MGGAGDLQDSELKRHREDGVIIIYLSISIFWLFKHELTINSTISSSSYNLRYYN